MMRSLNERPPGFPWLEAGITAKANT